MNDNNILLVEDNVDDEFLTLRTLAKSGFSKVEVVRDGVEALEYLFGNEGEALQIPGFILLDLKLPKIDGIEVLQAIRNNPSTAAVPVLIISSSREPSDYDRCRVLGVRVFLNKPLESQELEQGLRLMDIIR